jgi:diguanylate cyclase (GGDEF)-like protein
MTAANPVRMSALPKPAALEDELSAFQMTGSRVLVVDDIADNRAVITRRLLKRGFVVEEADGGRAALKKIEEMEFDLVLLDFMMPDLSGLEVVQAIRRRHAPLSLPVIMVTAKNQSDDIVQALAAGANDYVTKPVEFPVLLARSRTQLALKAAEARVQLANEQLTRANGDLEERVVQRTSELVETNRQLELQIAQREQSESTIRYLAYHDPLTGLGNRALFREELERALAKLRRVRETLSLLVLDLDGFKDINDTLGHTVGDNVLKGVAERLRNSLRETDVLVRLGGDEFAIIQFGDEQPRCGAALAGRLIEEIAQPMEVDGHSITVGASIGIATTVSATADPEQLVKAADLAMYAAKDQGKGTYRFFDTEMEERAQARRSLEQDLRRGLAENEFVLEYQPLVSTTTNAINGFEALVRWKHPRRGLVPPMDFIPMAEELGLIGPLGTWVLRKACEDAIRWPEDVKVAVNLSASQFNSGNVVATVLETLAATGLPAHRLELEITESVLLEKAEDALKTLADLHRIGVQIAMDDFGTGYSSLSYIRDYPFDKIKIDKTFVQGSDRKENLAIVRAVSGLGISFNVGTTAEGVETPEQLRRVAAEGCTEAQGYLFSQGMAAEDVPVFMQHWPAGRTASDDR